MDAVQRLRDRSFGCRQRIAVIADGVREHEHKPASGVVQIIEDLRVCSFGVGEIDALHYSPRRAWGAAWDHACPDRARIERLDNDAVIGGRAERREGRPLQRLLHERLPIRFFS